MYKLLMLDTGYVYRWAIRYCSPTFFTKPICTERREEVHRKGHQEAMPEPGMASSAKI